MATLRLTEASVGRVAKPAKGRTELSDIEVGLFLHVRATGRRGWVVVYRIAGIGDGGKRGPRVKMHLGDWPRITVDEARQQARKITDWAAAGRDPREELETAKRGNNISTVKAMADAWVRAMEAGQITGARKRPAAPSTIGNRETVLRLHIVPRIGTRAMDDVTPLILGAMLHQIDEAGGPADETLKTLNGLWSFAEGRGLVAGQRPTFGLRKRQTRKVEPRALSDNELHSIWGAAEHMAYPFGFAVQLLMLTGQRRSEICAAEWSWFNRERGTLTVPKLATKNRAGDHEVVLSQKAIEILEQTQAVHTALRLQSPYIFTSTTGKTPISGYATQLKRLARIRQEQGENDTAPQPWRLHDLRHTFITRARDGDQNAQGEVIWSAALDVVQAAVNHSMGGGVTEVYDHGSLTLRYRLRKRELANWWAGKLMKVVGG